jgi:hypothetical protein
LIGLYKIIKNAKSKSKSPYGDFKGDPNEYIAFKLFGTFVHDLIEKSQKKAISQGNVSINKVFNRDYFNERLTEFKEKEPFEIQK